MFRGKIKKQENIIWSWYENEQENEWPSKRVMSALKWFARHQKFADYGYQGDWRERLEYCSDRMNGGRAKSILRLIKRAKKLQKSEN